MPSSNQFITSSGRKIPFIEGYYDAHQRLFSYFDDDYIDKRRSGESITSPNPSYSGFTGAMVVYGMMMDMIDDYGIRRRFDAALDIGGCEGYVSRIMHADGIVKRAVCNDLYPPTHNLGNMRAVSYLARYQVRSLAAKLLPKGEALSPKGRTNKYGYLPSTRSKIFNIKSRRLPLLSEYLAGDVLEDGIPENHRYDFVTAIQMINELDYETLFRKISNILRPNGLFYVFASYWWAPVNRTRIFGHFPYASQRLTKEDLKRYLEEYHPERSEYWMSRYDSAYMGRVPPTIDDYVTAARSAGLELVGTRRYGTPLQPANTYNLPSPHKMSQLNSGLLDSVLQDISSLRDGVSMEDLQTQFVALLFRQPESDSRTIEEFLSNPGSLQPSKHSFMVRAAQYPFRRWF